MKKMRIAVLALLAVFAVGMVGAASASATFLVNKEGLALVKRGLTSFGASFTIESGEVKITCTKEKGTGEIALGSKTSGSETLTAEECALGALKCNSTGAAEGVVTLPWNIAFGLGAGVTRLLPMEVPPSGINFKCGSTEVKLRGGWLAKLEAGQEKTLRRAFLFRAEPNATEYSIMEVGTKTLKLEVQIGTEAFKAAKMSSATEEIVLEEEAELT